MATESATGLILSVVSLTVSFFSFVVSLLTFSTKLWQDYATKEFAKQAEAVKILETHKEVEAASSSIGEAKYKLDAWSLSKGQVGAPYGGCITKERLDYADIFLLQKLRAEINLTTDQRRELETTLSKLVEGRQRAATWWNVLVAKHESHQLLHKFSPKWVAWRKRVGLPVKSFFATSWAGRGKRHLELVEPLDVATWYSLVGTEEVEKMYDEEDTEIRPSRYPFLIEQAKVHLKDKLSQRALLEYPSQLHDRVVLYQQLRRLHLNLVIGHLYEASSGIT